MSKRVLGAAYFRQFRPLIRKEAFPSHSATELGIVQFTSLKRPNTVEDLLLGKGFFPIRTVVANRRAHRAGSGPVELLGTLWHSRILERFDG